VFDYDASILIVGYNSQHFLADCVSSIEDAARHHRVEILFTNNGTDTSEVWLAEHHPQVKVLPSRGNIGFAAGNNYLAGLALGRYLLLLNPDTKMEAGAIDALLDAADANPGYQILGGTTVDAQGKANGLAEHELPSLATILRPLVGAAQRTHRKAVERTGLIDAGAVNGGFMLVNREWWEKLGGMDGSFFLYAEELDLCRRLADVGGKVAVVPEARIFHDIGSGDVYSPTRKFYLATGNAHYYRKHFSAAYARACTVSYWLVALGRYAAGRLLAGRSERHARMAEAMRKVALEPASWMRGFDSPGADPRKGPA
jgi:N-acetylglucosaminyl-diphospho-decaprenol L-rhamnosyltransferase